MFLQDVLNCIVTCYECMRFKCCSILFPHMCSHIHHRYTLTCETKMCVLGTMLPTGSLEGCFPLDRGVLLQALPGTDQEPDRECTQYHFFLQQCYSDSATLHCLLLRRGICCLFKIANISHFPHNFRSFVFSTIQVQPRHAGSHRSLCCCTYTPGLWVAVCCLDAIICTLHASVSLHK